MNYDLTLLAEMCRDLGLKHQCLENELDIAIEDEVVLIFINYVENGLPSCACGFKGTAWHSHGDPIAFYTDDASIELSSLDVLSGLVDGMVLIGELWSGGALRDRSLIHKELKESYEYLAPGDEYRVRRPAITNRGRQSTSASAAKL